MNYHFLKNAGAVNAENIDNNKKGFSAKYNFDWRNGEISCLNVKINDKDGLRFANADLLYNTYSGEILNKTEIRLSDRDYGSTKEYTKMIKEARAFLEEMVLFFGKQNVLKRIKRQTAAIAPAKELNKNPRSYEYKIKEFQREGHYRHTIKGKVVYVKPSTIII